MRFVIIGASAAAINTARKLRELNPKDEIVLISVDTMIYSRCILHHYLEGARSLEELNFAGLDFSEAQSIQWMKGVAAISIDTKSNEVLLSDNSRVHYDKLCIASGAHTHLPPIPGLREGKNIIGFRNLSDVENIKMQLSETQNILIMGAGLVGIDALAGLLPYQKNLSLVDMGPYMLPIQLDGYSAKTYQGLFAVAGVKQYYNTGVKEFVLNKDSTSKAAILQDGTDISVDLVINCAGVRANVEFLLDSDIACDQNGLIVDEYGRTNIDNVFGAGDITGHHSIWPVAVKEGLIAAYSMSEKEKSISEYFSVKSSMHFLGLSTISIGNVNHYNENCNEDIFHDENGNYRKIVTENDVVIGALLQGDLSGSGLLSETILGL